ncbi:MAG: Crp/Fnr family transcriptional regulator [Acidobacteria bacterium]|nr:Crp/Fnr family transcriptional regulator [Acidobacteriota bacterium]
MIPTAVGAALKDHPFLEGVPERLLDKLSQLAFEVTFEEDQIIFREGDPSSFFYLILSGLVALELAAPGRVVTIQTVGDGEELGWSSLMSRVDKQFRARCMKPVKALAFDGARVAAECEEDHEFGYLIMRRILVTVAERLRSTRMQVLDVYSARGGQIK